MIGIPVFGEPMSWDDIDGDEEARERARQEAADDERALDVSFARCFTTTDGQRVLGYLRRMTVEMPTFDATMGMENGAAHGFAREGQNSLFHHITKRIERARSPRETGGENG